MGNKKDIDINKIIALKESGLTNKEIAEYLTLNGESVCTATIQRMVKEYYADDPSKQPKVKTGYKSKIKIEEVIELKEKGLSDEKIANILTEQGKKIGRSRVNEMIDQYYKSIGKEKPIVKKGKKEDVTVEDVFKLKENGLSTEDILRYYEGNNIDVSISTIKRRIKDAYKEEKAPRADKKTDISTKDLIELRKQDISYEEMSIILKKQGKSITPGAIWARLNRYYNKHNEENVLQKATRKEKIKINPIKILELKEKGLGSRKIAEQLKNEGINISPSSVLIRLKKDEYNETIFDEILKNEILFQGITIKEWCIINNKEELEEVLDRRAKRLEIIVKNAKKKNGVLVPDEQMYEVLNVINNKYYINPQNKFLPYLKPYMDNDKINNGRIDIIKMKVFKDNTDMLTYIFSRINPRFEKEDAYDEEYDKKTYNRYKSQFQDKVEKYFEVLHTLEGIKSKDDTMER